MEQVWNACIDCGCVKINQQVRKPRCKSCAVKAARSRPEVKERHRLAWTDAARLELHRQAVKEAMSSADVKDRHLTALNDPEVRIKLSLSHGGDGDLARIDRRREGTDVYRTSELSQWSRAVKQRDRRTCQHCGSNSYLHAHHIKPRILFPEYALEIDNGVTLCKTCHIAEHKRIRSSSSK